MSKKDYRRLAVIIHAARSRVSPGNYNPDGPRLSHDEVNTVFGLMEEEIALWLKDENPNFNSALFLRACREGQ